MEDNMNQWHVAEGNYDGQPLIFRLNMSSKQAVNDFQYAYRIGVSFLLKRRMLKGYPHKQELKTLNLIEDEITNYFDAKSDGILSIIITTQGMREFIIYTKQNSNVGIIEQLSQKFKAYDFQSYVVKDKKMNEYDQWEDIVFKSN